MSSCHVIAFGLHHQSYTGVTSCPCRHQLDGLEEDSRSWFLPGSTRPVRESTAQGGWVGCVLQYPPFPGVSPCDCRLGGLMYYLLRMSLDVQGFLVSLYLHPTPGCFLSLLLSAWIPPMLEISQFLVSCQAASDISGSPL